MSTDTKIANAIIQAELPTIQKALSKYIYANLHPLLHVTSGSWGLSEISIPPFGIKLEADAKYTITNLIGLQTLSINDMTATNTQGTSTAFTVDIEIDFALSNLTADISGKLVGSIGPVSISPGLSGQAYISEVRATGSGEMKVTVSEDYTLASLVSIDITHLNVGITDLEVDIDSLGVFNPFADYVVSGLESRYSSAIRSYVGKEFKSLIEHQINLLFPFHLNAQQL